MAEVHLATVGAMASGAKLAAIKTLHPNYAETARIKKLFADEASIGNQLYHPNIIQTYEFGDVDGVDFIALEYVHGKTLRELLLERALPVEVALYVMIQAAAGIGFAHRCRDSLGKEMNIVHRDISPKNILVSYEGQVKIADFGIARAQIAESETRTGEIKGTVSYMAPEQLRGSAVGPQADVYALGVTLFEVLTRQRLPEAGSPDYTAMARFKENRAIPTLDHWVPGLSKNLDGLLAQALAPRPEDRFADGDVFYRAILRIFEQLPDPLTMSEAISREMRLAFPNEVLRPPLAGFQLGSVSSQASIILPMPLDQPDGRGTANVTAMAPDPIRRAASEDTTHVPEDALGGPEQGGLIRALTVTELHESRPVTRFEVAQNKTKFSTWVFVLTLAMTLGAGVVLLRSDFLKRATAPGNGSVPAGIIDAAVIARAPAADSAARSASAPDAAAIRLSDSTNSALPSTVAASIHWRILSQPANAEVWVSGQKVGLTPLVWQVPAALQSAGSIRLKKRGYLSATRNADLTQAGRLKIRLTPKARTKPADAITLPHVEGLKPP